MIPELEGPGGMTGSLAGAWLKVAAQTWRYSLPDHGAAGDCRGAGAVAAVLAAVVVAAAAAVVSVAVERPEEAPWNHLEVPGSWRLETY